MTAPATHTTIPTPVIIDQKNLARVVPLHTLDGHLDSVTDVAFSPDSSLIASSSADGTVRLWRANDGSLLFTLEGHTDSVKSVSFSPNGTLLVSGSDDRTARIWRVSDGSLVRVLDTSLVGRAVKVQYSPDGSLLAIGGHTCYLMLRQSTTGNLRRTIKQPQCSSNEGGPIEFWGLAFSQDGTLLFAGEGRPAGGGGSIYAFDYEGYERPQLLRGYNFYVRDISLSPDGTTLVVALLRSPEILHLQVQDGTTIEELDGHTFSVNSVSFSPDGRLIVSGGRDSTVHFWQSSSGELLRILEGHEDTINRVVFSPDGGLIASCSDDKKIILWGIENP